MNYKKDDDEIDSEKEQAALRKKKRFPFHAKVGGGLARRRADRKAYQRGGAVSKADGEPESPNVPNAPVGGAVKQKFARGGKVESEKADIGMPMHGGVDIGKEDKAARYKSGGRITAGERQALPKSDFALPGQGKGPKGAGAGSYPIDTENRARNALARGAQHAGPAKLATIKRKVKAKYPDIDVS
jgi:hypothetical protein